MGRIRKISLVILARKRKKEKSRKKRKGKEKKRRKKEKRKGDKEKRNGRKIFKENRERHRCGKSGKMYDQKIQKAKMKKEEREDCLLRPYSLPCDDVRA